MRNQGAAEFLPQQLRCNRGLALGDILDALDARLDHVKIGDAQAIKLVCHIAENRGRIAVRHRAIGAARREPHAHAIGSPDRDRSLRDLQQEARTVFDGTTVFIRALVRTC
jgi:hypothetical protein